ncbi:hypothetical protein [Clostridium cadaveris]|uniref:hypothetical protein n=1 Tax=Clostridium cadaveris TaxID=1529 RepID=UPI00321804BB
MKNRMDMLINKNISRFYMSINKMNSIVIKIYDIKNIKFAENSLKILLNKKLLIKHEKNSNEKKLLAGKNLLIGNNKVFVVSYKYGYDLINDSLERFSKHK